MSRKQVIETLLANKIMGLVRTDTKQSGQDLAQALISAGLKSIEITLTSPGALEIVKKLANNKNLTVGVGTVLTTKEVSKAKAAGAKFIVSPNTDTKVIKKTIESGLVSMPGVATASDVAKAIAAGADILKLFPASTYGPAHLKALRDPFPGQIWCPTGGVTVESISEWVKVGAKMFGLGGPLTRDGVSNVARNLERFTTAINSANKVS
jgi:2-dehydro-3-deoxyphosphogluconate aldolase/(4S)-4-hydroxy-2-oxoglutarate aldolase